MDRPRILLLCTANQCRSPMAEALLRRSLDEQGVSADISSAGLYPPGALASAGAVDAMSALGLDISSHRSRQVSDEMVSDADLLIGLARHHVREAVYTDPAVWKRAFSLKELVRRGEEVGARRADESLADWLERANEGRQRADLLGPDDDFDDVVDPIGGPPQVYQAAAEEIAELIRQLVQVAFTPGASTGTTTSSTTTEG